MFTYAHAFKWFNFIATFMSFISVSSISLLYFYSTLTLSYTATVTSTLTLSYPATVISTLTLPYRPQVISTLSLPYPPQVISTPTVSLPTQQHPTDNQTSPPVSTTIIIISTVIPSLLVLLMLVCMVLVIILIVRCQNTRKEENAAYEHIVSHERTGENTSLTCVNNNSRLFIIQLVYSDALQVYIFSKQKQDCSQVSPRNILQPLSLFLAESCVTVVGIPVNGFILQWFHFTRLAWFQDYYVLDIILLVYKAGQLKAYKNSHTCTLSCIQS